MTQINLLAGKNVGTALNATNSEANNPHCIHSVGLGKSGCESVAALLKQPEVCQLLLSDIRATLAVLCIDTEDTYLKKVEKEGEKISELLIANGVDQKRIVIKTVKMEIPKTEQEKEAFFESINNVPKYFKLEYPMKPVNPNYKSWLDPKTTVIPAEGEHVSRAVAKALYFDNYYRLGLKKEIQEFCTLINNSSYPGYVYLFFSLTGGLGSGIVSDLARHLSNVWFGRRQTLAGFAYLPSEADSKESLANAYTTLEELEVSINSNANPGVMKVFGQTYMCPWLGGFFLVARDQDDTTTNKRLAEFLSDGNTRHFIRSATCTGKVRAPWTEANNADRPWNVIVLKDFDGKSPQTLKDLYANDGCTKDFKSDYINIDCYIPENVKEKADEVIKNATQKVLLSKEDGGRYTVDFYESKEGKAYVIIPGQCLRDIKAFNDGKNVYDKLEKKDQIMASSYLLDCGLIISNRSKKKNKLAGESIWDADGFIVYPYEALRSEGEYPVYRPVTYKAGCDDFEQYFIHDENPLPGESKEEYIAKFTKSIGYNMRLRG